MPRIYARALTDPTSGRAMNRVESRYADVLQAQALCGTVIAWGFEVEGLRLAAQRCVFWPDFRVIMPDGLVEFHECKAGVIRGGKVVARMTDDARVKLLTAAEIHPYIFRLVVARPDKALGGWDITRVGSDDDGK